MLLFGPPSPKMVPHAIRAPGGGGPFIRVITVLVVVLVVAVVVVIVVVIITIL